MTDIGIKQQDFYYKTSKGERADANNSGIERRGLMLLRLIDGRTPVERFQKSLRHFDIVRLFAELLSAGLIARVTTATESSRIAPVSDSTGRLPPLPDRRETPETSVDTNALHRTFANDPIRSRVQEQSEVDPIAAFFMKKYVKSLNSDDPEIKRFISNQPPNST